MNFTSQFMPNFAQPTATTQAPQVDTTNLCNQGMQPTGYFAQPVMTAPCGCCPQAVPTFQCCNQVVNRCNVQDVPHITNYHTHVVDNCVRRHINIPQYTTSESVQVFDEFVQGQPIFQGPVGAPISQDPFGTPGYAQPMNMFGTNNPFNF